MTPEQTDESLRKIASILDSNTNAIDDLLKSVHCILDTLNAHTVFLTRLAEHQGMVKHDPKRPIGSSHQDYWK